MKSVASAMKFTARFKSIENGILCLSTVLMQMHTSHVVQVGPRHEKTCLSHM